MVDLPVYLEDVTETQHADCVIGEKNLSTVLYILLHPLFGADSVSGEGWQLITVMHGEGDGSILCERQSQGCNHTDLLDSVNLMQIIW